MKKNITYLAVCLLIASSFCLSVPTVEAANPFATDAPEVTSRLDKANEILEKNPQQAHQLLIEAAKMAPNSSRAHLGLAAYYIKMKDFKTAYAETTEALPAIH
jgi:Tfp pilus assembly protein PilF